MSKRGAFTAALAGVGVALAAAAPASADVATIREATAANAPGIQAAVDAFRADLGEPNNGNTVGTQVRKGAKMARSTIRSGGRATAKLGISATDTSGNETETAEKVRLG